MKKYVAPNYYIERCNRTMSVCILLSLILYLLFFFMGCAFRDQAIRAGDIQLDYQDAVLKDAIQFSRGMAQKNIEDNPELMKIINGVACYKVVVGNDSRSWSYKFEIADMGGRVLFSKKG